MKIIIIGAGKIGVTLIENFIKEQHDVVIIDTMSEQVTGCVNRYDINGVIGNGIERDTLIEAGITDADFLIACTSRDEVNILCCVLAKKLGAKKTIARVRDPQYFSEMENMRKDLGLDLAFNPELQTALEIERVLKFPSATTVETFAGGRATMVEFDIEKGNSIIGKSIMQICKDYGNDVLFGMIVRGGKSIIPKGDCVIEQDDIVYIIGDETDLGAFAKKIKIFKPKAKSVFIIGGGKIAYYLSKSLLSNGVGVKVMENDKQRCNFLSEELVGATVLLGDGTDHGVLEEEGLKNSDACITLTGIDEENVIISLFAKMQKVNKIITKIDRPLISSMVKDFGLDTIISPKTVTANHIVKFVREHQAETNDVINNLYLLGDKVEVLEFTATESFSQLNVSLKQMKIKKNVLIGGIVREGNFILPTGDTTICINDRIILVSQEKMLNELKDILL